MTRRGILRRSSYMTYTRTPKVIREFSSMASLTIWLSERAQNLSLSHTHSLPSFLQPQRNGCTFQEGARFSPGLHLSIWWELEDTSEQTKSKKTKQRARHTQRSRTQLTAGIGDVNEVHVAITVIPAPSSTEPTHHHQHLTITTPTHNAFDTPSL